METGVIWDPRIHKKALGLGDFDASWDCKILHSKVGGIEVDNMVLPGSLCTGFNFKSMLEFNMPFWVGPQFSAISPLLKRLDVSCHQETSFRFGKASHGNGMPIWRCTRDSG